jgi:hypothetical protein
MDKQKKREKEHTEKILEDYRKMLLVGLWK